MCPVQRQMPMQMLNRVAVNVPVSKVASMVLEKVNCTISWAVAFSDGLAGTPRRAASDGQHLAASTPTAAPGTAKHSTRSAARLPTRLGLNRDRSGPALTGLLSLASRPR